MNPTLPIAKHLRKLLVKRQYLDEDIWLKAVAEVGRQALSHLDAKLHLPHNQACLGQGASSARNPHQDAKDSVGVHGYGQSLKVIEFCQRVGLMLNPKEHWWTLERPELAKQTCKDKKQIKELLPRTGYIHGLDNSRGWPRITNGIDVWIERADGTLFKGHRDWLRWDRRAKDLTPKPANEVGSRCAKPKALPEAYLTKAKEIVANDKVDSFAEKYFAKLGKPPMLMLDDEQESILSVAKAINEYMESVVLV